MISFSFASIFAMSAFADHMNWDGIACGDNEGMGKQCQYGLEWVYEFPEEKKGIKKCCQKGFKSTIDDCKCLPCANLKPCDSTAGAQQDAYEQYKAMNFSDQDAKAASETYMCAWNPYW